MRVVSNDDLNLQVPQKITVDDGSYDMPGNPIAVSALVIGWATSGTWDHIRMPITISGSLTISSGPGGGVTTYLDGAITGSGHLIVSTPVWLTATNSFSDSSPNVISAGIQIDDSGALGDLGAKSQRRIR